MRSSKLFRASALLLLSMPTWSATLSLPDAQYRINVSYGINDNGGDAISASAPGSYQVGCGLIPICASATVSATPSPTIVVSSTTSAVFLGQAAEADVNITYDYGVDCPTCAPCTVVPLTVTGFLQFDFSFGFGSTLQGGGATVDVFGFDSIHNFAGANMAEAVVGGNLCVNVFFPVSSSNCTLPAAGTFTLPTQVRVNQANQITISAGAGFFQSPSTAETSFAVSTVDPVISFAPGFDSTGYEIVVSPGIGNQAASVPEPGTWALFGLGAAMVVLRARRVRHS
jgi:hypothetical protein